MGSPQLVWQFVRRKFHEWKACNGSRRASGIAVAATGGISWRFAHESLRRCAVDESLQPIAELLKDNRGLVDALIHDGATDSGPAILDNYLQRIRKDGVAKNSVLKQRIETLVNNNTVIVALLSKYSTHVRTPAFKGAAEQYRNYAISFRDRWQSVFQIFMAGGNLPAAGPEYPAQFAAAIDQELAAD